MTDERISPQARALGKQAEAYERARPDYPDAAIKLLVEQLELVPGTVVVDVGAGTGKFTRLLLETGARVVAVEPLEDMRRVFAEVLPEAELLAGAAESIPLPDGFADAATAAQAFHWFHAKEAVTELHRVLRLGGKVALIWNIRDEAAEPWASLAGVINRYRTGAPLGEDWHEWQAAFAQAGLFEPMQRAGFPHTQTLDRELGLDRVMSISFLAELDDAEHQRVRERLADLLPPQVTFPYTTRVFWTTRR